MLYRKVVRQAVAETEGREKGDRIRVLKVDAASDIHVQDCMVSELRKRQSEE
jgi:hypothetical protein